MTLILSSYMEIPRKLGYLPDGVPAHAQALKPKSFASFFPLVPETEWYELSRRSCFDSRFQLDQGRYASCVAVASAMAAQKVEAIEGQDFTLLSWQFLYNQINYGVDIGSNIYPDAYNAIMNIGICREELFRSPGPLDKNQIPQMAYDDAKNHQALDVYQINTWVELVSAVLMKIFIPIFPVRLGLNFGGFLDADDIAQLDVGMGNHAVHADGVKRIKGQWCVDCQNSYPNWGRHGRGYLTKEHVATAMGPGMSGYVIRSMKWGSNNPPKPIF